MKQIVLVVGARPNFMKAAPLIAALQNKSNIFKITLIHTGQHYDHNLSQLFFDDLQMPESDIYLGVGSGTHAEQTAEVMIQLEKQLLIINPDLVIVFGDINSTLATAVVTAKLKMKLAHVEAGLRSFDMTMPEEVNRIVTDRLSHFHFVTEQSGVENLKREGVKESSIYLTGNIMIDSLVITKKRISHSDILTKLNLAEKSYYCLTMHRPSNVDNKEKLEKFLKAFQTISEKTPIIFPCHPRTLKMIEQFGLSAFTKSENFRFVEPLGYLDFLSLMAQSKAVITDSGGIQGDTTFLRIPCLTIRSNTEQPVTVSEGTNTLCSDDIELLLAMISNIETGSYKQGKVPEFWDGKSAERVVEIIEKSI
ncbi:MAG: UDP-N-acetylglucosamine 2-epimerase (non-hydrolyzing) [Calditrichaeota bacterium]|nr:MAG: UDP-N-acetylglucosamine 2-epimerase (non-hydrolyzing) [Calditrichota bacterium]